MMPAKTSTDETGHIGRRIGPYTATSIVVANMIGAGIFTTSGIVAAQVPGAGWVIVCYLLGGMIALSGALCYAELATRMPEEGGEYVYLKKLYHPALGFLTGWTSFLAGFSAPIAASALGFAEYISPGFNRHFPGMSSTGVTIEKKAIAAAIILLFTIIHYVGIRLGSIVQNTLTAIKIAIVLGLASLGLIFGFIHGHWGGAAFSLATANRTGTVAFGSAMMLVMFAYSGWNASSYIAGELKNPRRTLPLSLLGGTGIVIFLYLAVNIFVLQSVPFDVLRVTKPVLEEASRRAFGDWIGNVLGMLAGLALLSSLSAYIILGPRVYYAMAQDRLFFPLAARVHKRFGVPGASILLQGAIAMLMVAFGTLEQIAFYVGFALGIFPWLAVIGVFLARKKGIGEESAARVWGYPVVPVFYLISSLALMIIAYINDPSDSSIALISIALGIPCYFLLVKTIKPERAAGSHSAPFR